MANFRKTFVKPPAKPRNYTPKDLDDFWLFVKKELKID
jgi:hypothetical protein